jgi:hypothetical protein
VEYRFGLPALQDQPWERTVEFRVQSNLVHDDAEFRVDDFKLLAKAEPRPYVIVDPRRAELFMGGTARLRAHLVRGSGQPVRWVMREAQGGTLDPDGTYRAPDTPGTYHAVASCDAAAGLPAEVSIRVLSQLEVSPRSEDCAPGQSVRFMVRRTPGLPAPQADLVG